MTVTTEQRIQITGSVVFASRIAKPRCVIQPDIGKRIICNFQEPQKLRKGQQITVVGIKECEGWESIVLNDCVLTDGHADDPRNGGGKGPKG